MNVLAKEGGVSLSARIVSRSMSLPATGTGLEPAVHSAQGKERKGKERAESKNNNYRSFLRKQQTQQPKGTNQRRFKAGHTQSSI